MTSQMSAHVWQSAMQTRIARTSSSMRSESAHAMQVCTQFKEASIAAATSTRSSGACWGEASSIWRVSVMLVLVFVVALLSWLGRSLHMVALVPPARPGFRGATRRTFRKMIQMRVPPRHVYPRYPQRPNPGTPGRCEIRTSTASFSFWIGPRGGSGDVGCQYLGRASRAVFDERLCRGAV